AVLCAFTAHVSRAVRWNMLIKPLGYKPKVLNSFYAVMFGYSANTLVPRAGEVSRCVLLNRAEGVPVAKLLGTVVAERIFDLIALAIFLVAVVLIEFELMSETLLNLFGQKNEGQPILHWYTALVVVGAGIFGYFALRFILRSKFGNKFKELFAGLKEGVKSVLRLQKAWLFIVHTILIWVMYFFMAYLCFFAVPETAHLGLKAGLTTFVLASVGFIAPVPGGTGTYQYMFILAVGLYGVGKEDAGTTANIAFSANTLFNLFVGGLSYVIVAFAHKKVKPQVTEANAKE
ncbi:MAG: flippase-like domain-containing protein, partial [Bacteroidetes bacterium]|nr:flippase-like domain-containing protein [Bacteroidota bacterium]